MIIGYYLLGPGGRFVQVHMQLGINLVTSMLGHLLYHFNWTPPQRVKPKDLDISETPGLVTYMGTPLQAIPTPRLSASLYKRLSMDIYSLRRWMIGHDLGGKIKIK